MRKRRINRGQPKSREEVSRQVVEDMIAARLHDIDDRYKDSIGVLLAKVLFHQEQLRCAGHALDLFASEVENRSYNARELLGRLVETQSAIFNDMIPVDNHEDYADLTKEVIQAHLARHCGDYNGELDLADPYEDDDGPVEESEWVPERLPTPRELRNLQRRANSEARRAYRRAGLDTPEEVIDDDDIISAVSDEVQEDLTPRRRRRR